MNITEERNGGNVHLEVEGRIDGANCAEFQDRLLKSFLYSNTVTLDMEGVIQLSSAALRALLLGKKTAESKGGSFVVLNVSPAVSDVFRVTGFDKLLDIR